MRQWLHGQHVIGENLRLAACRKIMHGFLKSCLRDNLILIMACVRSSLGGNMLTVSSRDSAQNSECCLVAQATPTQQAEMKKVKGLQEKLGTELASLAQRMADLQVQGQKYEAVDGAKNQVNKASCSPVVVQTLLVSPTVATILASTVNQQRQLCSLVPGVDTATHFVKPKPFCKAENNLSSHAADWLLPVFHCDIAD